MQISRGVGMFKPGISISNTSNFLNLLIRVWYVKLSNGKLPELALIIMLPHTTDTPLKRDDLK